MKVKKLTLDGQELAMLYQAFAKKLFVRPCKGDIQSRAGDTSILYFKMSYYDSLKEDIQKAYWEGKYRESNAEVEWVRLMNDFLSAVTEDMPIQCTLEDYYETVSYYWPK